MMQIISSGFCVVRFPVFSTVWTGEKVEGEGWKGTGNVVMMLIDAVV